MDIKSFFKIKINNIWKSIYTVKGDNGHPGVLYSDQHESLESDENYKVYVNENDDGKINNKDYYTNYFPIGYTYIQFPNEKSPGELNFYGNWTYITNFNGAFFRAEGGKAEDFQYSTENEINEQSQSMTKLFNNDESSQILFNGSYSNAMYKLGTKYYGDGWDKESGKRTGDFTSEWGMKSEWPIYVGVRKKWEGDCFTYFGLKRDFYTYINSKYKEKTNNDVIPTNRVIRIWKRTS